MVFVSCLQSSLCETEHIHMDTLMPPSSSRLIPIDQLSEPALEMVKRRAMSQVTIMSAGMCRDD